MMRFLLFSSHTAGQKQRAYSHSVGLFLLEGKVGVSGENRSKPGKTALASSSEIGVGHSEVPVHSVYFLPLFFATGKKLLKLPYWRVHGRSNTKTSNGPRIKENSDPGKAW